MKQSPLSVLTMLLSLVGGCQGNQSPAGKRPPVDAPVASAVRGSAGGRQKSCILLQDRTGETGVQFTYRNDDEHSDYSILESLGGGVAIFDYDGDGRRDVMIPGGGQFGERQVSGRDSALFRNTTNWTFVDVSVNSGVNRSRFYSHGAAAADYNEDGFDDVLVTGYGGLTLYRNQGWNLSRSSGMRSGRPVVEQQCRVGRFHERRNSGLVCGTLCRLVI